MDRSFSNAQGATPSPSAQPALDLDISDSGQTAISYLFWLACCSGFFGLHRLYNGKIATGLLWLCTFGLLGIGQVVDLALIPKMAAARSRQLKQRKYQLGQFDHPGVIHNPESQAQPLTMQLLQLAKRNKGRLLVTDCVLETGANFDEIESQLKALVKSGYAHVTNDINTGVVVYEIPELESA